jgi:hypothetical protein
MDVLGIVTVFMAFTMPVEGYSNLNWISDTDEILRPLAI